MTLDETKNEIKWKGGISNVFEVYLRNVDYIISHVVNFTRVLIRF